MDKPAGTYPRRLIQLAATAFLATFLPGLRGTLRIILEVATALLSAFATGFRCTLGIFGEVTFTTTMFSHFGSPVWFIKSSSEGPELYK